MGTRATQRRFVLLDVLITQCAVISASGLSPVALISRFTMRRTFRTPPQLASGLHATGPVMQNEARAAPGKGG